MDIKHISIVSNNSNKSTLQNIPNSNAYLVKAEFNEQPGNLWKNFFTYEWIATHYYSRTKCSPQFSGNELTVIVADGDELQGSINCITETVKKSNNFIKTHKRNPKYNTILYEGNIIDESILDNTLA